MRNLVRVPTGMVVIGDDHPRQPVKSIVAGLAVSMTAVGQQVPCLGYRRGDGKVVVLDGGHRLMAAIEAGIAELEFVLLEKCPTPAEQVLAILGIDLHCNKHLPSQLACLLGRAVKETGLTLSGVCEKIGMSQSYGSKMAALVKLAPEALALVDAGSLSIEKAYSLSQEPDHAKQLAMLDDAKTLSREALRKRVHNGPSAEVTASAVRLAMPDVLIQLRGSDLTIDRCIDVLSNAVKQLKKALSQGLDVSTAQAVFKDTAKVR